MEFVINSRPLLYVGEDLENGHVLSPSDFLSLNPRRDALFPESATNCDSERTVTAKEVLQMWKSGQEYLNQFWKMWRQEEYLQTLRERSQYEHKQNRIVSN